MTKKSPNLCAIPPELTTPTGMVPHTDARRVFLGKYPLVYRVEDPTPNTPVRAVPGNQLIACVDITAKKVAFCIGCGVRIEYLLDKTEILPGRGFKAFVHLPDGTQFTFVGIRIRDEEVAGLTLP